MPPAKRNVASSSGSSRSPLDHFPHYDKLSAAAERALATRLIGLEKAIASAFSSSADAARALQRVADDIEEGHLPLRDVLRSSEAESEPRRPRSRVLRSLRAVGDDASERTPSREILGGLGLHRRILDRVAASIPVTDPVAQQIAGLRKQADQCKSDLVRANLGVAVAVARRLKRRDVDVDDLIQEGTIGMLRACDKFDPARGHRFSTYAAFWARQQILRALVDHIPEIRVPLDVASARSKVLRTAVALARKNGRPPTVAEVAQGSGVAPSMIAIVNELAPPPLSLHAPLGDTGQEVLDAVADASIAPVDIVLESAQESAMVHAWIGRLCPRDASILNLRFGLRQDPPLTLREVGARLNLSAERVRRIEERALKRLAELGAPMPTNGERSAFAA